MNGQDAGVTPADVALADLRGGKVRLSKRGYRAADVRASSSQVESGVVLMKLVPEPTGISVALYRQLSVRGVGWQPEDFVGIHAP